MSLDVVILIAGGLIAIFAGGMIWLVSRGRLVSFTAGAALTLLGLLQFGYARAVFEHGPAVGETWFEYALALGLAVSGLWVILSAVIGRPQSVGTLRVWRLYVALIATLALGALVAASLLPTPPRPAGAGAAVFPLGGMGRWILAITVVNLVLTAGNFEAAQAAAPRRYRNAFRLALLGVIVYAGYFVYLFTSSLFTGGVSIADLSTGAVPIAILSLLLSVALVRGRIGLVRTTRDRPSVGATVSLFLAFGVLVGAAGLLALTRAAGASFGRGIWILAVGGTVIGIAGLAISNRFRRRIQRMLDPIFFAPRRSWRSTGREALDSLARVSSWEELIGRIPETSRRVANVDPVTLLLAEEGTRRFRAIASTMSPIPSITIGEREPLPVELRRAGRPICLLGPADDLEYVSIYVENGAQISACGAACAVPLFGEEDLIGILLCGNEPGLERVPRGTLQVLHGASRWYAQHIERVMHGKSCGARQ